MRYVIGYPKRGMKGKRNRNASNLKTPAVVVALRYALDVCPTLVYSKPCNFIQWVKTSSSSDHKSHLNFLGGAVFNLAVFFWRLTVIHFLAESLSAVPGTAEFRR